MASYKVEVEQHDDEHAGQVSIRRDGELILAVTFGPAITLRNGTVERVHVYAYPDGEDSEEAVYELDK